MQSQGASLRLKGVSWRPKAARAPLLHETSLAIAPGSVFGVVGPNGAGKTTLLRLLYRFQKPSSGRVEINGEDIWRLPAKTVARLVAAVLQEQPTDFSLSVRQIVALGRTPHQAGFGGGSDARDLDVVEAVLDRMDLQKLVDRRLSTLSGGERQRVMVARALAQEPLLLVLDEPTNHLDIRHQLEVLELIRDLPLTIVISLHDLNMAARVCDTLLLLKAGRTVLSGPPTKVLTETNVSDAFQIDARREHLSPSKTDHLTFHLQTNGTA